MSGANNATGCVCGHPRALHQHYRAGTDCAECGAAACVRFRHAAWWRRLPGLGGPERPQVARTADRPRTTEPTR